MDGGEGWRYRATAGEGEEEAGGSGEIAVEALEETEERHDKNELNGPVLADAMFEGDGSGEAFAEKGLPGRDISDGGNGEGVEKGADSESKSDSLHVALLTEIGVGFFGVFGDGFETG